MSLIKRALASLAILSIIAAGCGSAAPSGTPPPPAGASQTPPSPAAATPAPSALATLPALADMPFYRNDPSRSAIQPGPGPASKPVQAWQQALGDSHFLPILVNGLVIAGSKIGTVEAVDARTGIKRWTFTAGGPVGGSAAAANGLVFVGDTNSVFGLDEATGTQRWVTPNPSADSRPVVVDGIVYSSSIGGVVGLDATTGKQVWRWAGPEGVAAAIGPIADGVAFVSAGDGRVYAIDIRTGSERWHVQTIGVTVGYAEVVGDTVYVGTTQGDAPDPVGELYAIDRATGAIRWRFRAPSGFQINAGPVKDGVMYTNAEHDGLYALRDDGSMATVLWRVDAPRSYWPTALVSDTVYQQRADSSVGAYAITDGHLEWETSGTGDEAGGPLISGGMVFQVQDHGGLVGYATPDVIALLPASASSAPPSPSTTPATASDPFAQIGVVSWSKLGVGTVLGMDVGPDGLLYVLDSNPRVSVIEPGTGKVVRTWGHSGAGPGEFDFSRSDGNAGFGDISVAPNGNVYVADGLNHRVQVFKKDGTYISQFGSFGTGPGQFSNLAEIEVAPDGSIYVLDDLNEPLSKYTAADKFSWRSPLGSDSPDVGAYVHGIAIRADGTPLLTCEDCHKLLMVDPKTGTLAGQIPVNELKSGGLIGLDGKGDMVVWQFYPESLTILDPAGHFLAGREVGSGVRETTVGEAIDWGDIYWPVPVFLPDGRAFSFGKDGLVELKVTLP